jgi:hypothetical protein
MPNRLSCGKTGVHSLPVLVALLALAGCSHQDPFPNGDPTPNGPRTSTPPVQLTYSLGFDQSPAWLADGSGFTYSLDQEGGPAGNRCLGEMPAAGGTRRFTKCVAAANQDSIRALGPAVPGPDGRVAWMDARSLNGRKTPDVEVLRVGTIAPQDSGVPVRAFPYLATSGKLHVTATSLTWLSPTRLAYIANDRLIVGPCSGCKPDTLLVPREAVLLDLSTSPATIALIPNTAEVTSLFASADGASLYFTRGGDTRVFQRVLASGAESTVHDFGGPITRDVAVRGNELTAVVGGKVHYGVDPIIGARQVDSGGTLVRVDLTSGNESPLALGSLLVRRPAPAPDGRSVVIEARDTLAPGFQTDLWLLPLP